MVLPGSPELGGSEPPYLLLCSCAQGKARGPGGEAARAGLAHGAGAQVTKW